MALMKVKATVERVLEKNLQDLVRGIRNNKENESKYIAECIEEIKHELKTGSIATKAIAVNKINYLQMLGYDISWAAFNVIEVMSSSKFTHKRVGYLAASQSFHAGTDVLMLTTNMVRKDLCSAQLYDVGVAMSGLACFMSPDLARDIANDVMTLMTSSKAYVRKKAILLMYKVFLCYPDSLRVAFPRLKERLEDADAGVQAAAVNVIGELARKNPRNYLSLAPVFFKLMTTSTSNWVLIKIIKLFAALTPLEPRLGKKLIEPLTNLIHSTSAMSLLYECINTVIAVLISITSSPGVTESTQTSAVQLCVQKLRILIEDSDQNLKYLGLLAMARILKTHPKSVQAHKDLILGCLDDKDESIRLRALDLLYGMISKKTLMEIVKKLLVHAEKAEGTFYRDELLAKVIDICSQNNYQYVTNFEWYVSVLVDLTRLESTKHGALIAAQMLDVAIRVPSVRAFAVSQMAVLVDNAQLVVGVSSQAQSAGGVCEVFYAAVFLCAEFSDYLDEPSKTLAAMLKPKISIFPGHIQSVFVHNALKLWVKLVAVAVSNSDFAAFSELIRLVRDRLPQFMQNADLEVQERASVFDQLVRAIEKLSTEDGEFDASMPPSRLPSQQLADELIALFGGDLNPVAPKAQKKVPVPEGLDLDSWINEPPPPPVTVAKVSMEIEKQSSSSTASPGRAKHGSPSSLASHATGGDYNTDRSMTSFSSAMSGFTGNSASIGGNQKRVDLTAEEMQRMRDNRLQEQQANPHYLKPSAKSSSNANTNASTAAATASTSNSSSRAEPETPLADTSVPSSRDIAGLVTSDKFLHDYRRSVLKQDAKASQLKEKKGKKGEKTKKKRKQAAEAELDLDEEPSVVVLTKFDAPTAADAPDDNELEETKKGKANVQLRSDDPHRALAEIDLDEPLKDGELKLPERKHRTDQAPSQKANELLKQKTGNTADNSKSTEKTESKKVKAKAKEPEKATVNSKEKEKGNRSEELKKKTKKGKVAAQEEPIILFDESEVVPPRTNGNAASPVSSTALVTPVHLASGNAVDEAAVEAGERDKKETSPSTETKKKASGKKKAVAEKSKGSKSAKSKARQQSGDRDRSEYEQTFDDLLKGAGDESSRSQTVAQPSESVTQLLGQSNSRSSPSTPASRFSSFKLLAENSSLSLMYQIRVQRTQPQLFVLALGFLSKANDASLRRFEFTVLDTMNIKLCRDAGVSQFDAVPLAFQLSSGIEQECQFAFTVNSISVLQKLRGSVTYIVAPNGDADSSLPEKLDFVLSLPCSSFLLQLGDTKGEQMDSDQFAALLSNGELSAKYAASVKLGELDTSVSFTSILERLASAMHFKLVERVGDSASLYARSIQRHDVCLLIKFTAASRTMTIEGKSTDSSLVSNLVDEMKSLVSSLASV